jgi:hypothetical protein
MDDRTKWLEWLKADPLTALTCYESARLDWPEAWKEHSKRFLPDSLNITEQSNFDLEYDMEISEYGVYGFRVCGDYWLTICYFNDEVILYKSTENAVYWEDNEILLRFDRPDSVYPHEIIATAMREIEPYIYHLLFPRTVQTKENEA